MLSYVCAAINSSILPSIPTWQLRFSFWNVVPSWNKLWNLRSRGNIDIHTVTFDANFPIYFCVNKPVTQSSINTLYRCQTDLVTFQSMMTLLVPANNSQKGIVILSLQIRNLKQDLLMQEMYIRCSTILVTQTFLFKQKWCWLKYGFPFCWPCDN